MCKRFLLYVSCVTFGMVFFCILGFSSFAVAANADHAGIYLGEYTGNDSGLMGLVIDNSGKAYGISASYSGYGAVVESFSTAGSTVSGTYDTGGSFQGSIGNNKITGTWQNGSFSGSFVWNKWIPNDAVMNDYYGAYHGTYTGNDYGEFICFIDAAGKATFLGASQLYDIGMLALGNVDVQGEMSLNGAATTGATLSGSVRSGTMSGSWNNSAQGYAGNFSAKRLSTPYTTASDSGGSGDSGGGGGGGGCTATASGAAPDLIALLAAGLMLSLRKVFRL